MTHSPRSGARCGDQDRRIHVGRDAYAASFDSIQALLRTVKSIDAPAQAPLEPRTWNVSLLAGASLDPDARAASTVGLGLGHNVSERVTLEAEVSRLFDLAPDDDDIDAELTTSHPRREFGPAGAGHRR